MYYFIYFGARKMFRQIMQHICTLRKLRLVQWYRNLLFREITMVCDTKYLNKHIVTFRKIIFDAK